MIFTNHRNQWENPRVTHHLCPILPHAANVCSITHHADNLWPITRHEKPFCHPDSNSKVPPGWTISQGVGKFNPTKSPGSSATEWIETPPLPPPPSLISSPYDWDLFDYFLSKSWRITHRFIFHGSMLTSKNVNRSNNNRFFFLLYFESGSKCWRHELKLFFVQDMHLEAQKLTFI